MSANARKNQLRVVAPPTVDENPPMSIEAEQAVLGAILQDARILDDVSSVLTAERFYRGDHQIIFQAMLDLAAKGEPIDNIALANVLENKGDLSRIGGGSNLEGMLYFGDLVQATASAANARYHAAIVREKAVKREIIEQLRLGLACAYHESDTADALRASVMTSLATIAPSVAPDAASYATLADADRRLGEDQWLWPNWIMNGAISILSARGGVGKTRIAMDLIRRLWFGLPLPDGQANIMPIGSTTLWLFVDRNWRSAAKVARAYGVPLDAIKLPSHRDNPIHTPELDDPETILALERQILEQKPAMMVIDTITYATARKTGQAEEAKAAFDPLMNLAAKTGIAVLALTHVNSDGETLGRRIEERARVNMHLTCPDSGRSDRLRFWVQKTDDVKPKPIGVTLHADRCDYDDNPPEPEEQQGRKPTGFPPAKSTKHAEWLKLQLETAGRPVPVRMLVDLARTDGIMKAPTEANPKPSISPLYAAKDRIPVLMPGFVVAELVIEDDRGKSLKHWAIEAEGTDESNRPAPEATADWSETLAPPAGKSSGMIAYAHRPF